MELHTFEVKTGDALDVTAVYEALAHRRGAHFSYVLACIPDRDSTMRESMFERLCGDAADHGVGFVVVADPVNYETWDFEVEPARHDPEPGYLDNFIHTQTSRIFKDTILKWCRTP